MKRIKLYKDFRNKLNIGLIGGAESIKTLKVVFDELNSNNILVVTTATLYKEDAEKKYADRFGRLGYSTDFIHSSNSSELDTQENLMKLAGVDTIFFVGGDQSRITGCFSGTKFLRKMLSSGINLVGSSAGSMALSHHMISGGKEDPIMSIGLSVLPDVIIDTHFKERSRETRLGSAVRNNGKIGWGISEDSAIIIKDGNMKTLGDVKIIS